MRPWHAGGMAHQEHTPPHGRVHHSERVGPPVFAWCLLVLMSVSLGLAYGAVVGSVWGLVTFLVVQVGGTVWLAGSRALVQVDDDTFVAGRATLPLEFVGTVTALDARATTDLAGPHADARAYLLLRGSTRTAVRVDLEDPADPTPYWLVATRRPEQLRDALTAAAASKHAAP